MSHRLSLHLLTEERFQDPERGLRVFELLEELAPAAAPERWGYWEPPPERFADGGAQRVVAHEDWGRHHLLWKARQRGVEGSLWPRSSTLDDFGRVSLAGLPLATDHDVLVTLLASLAVEFGGRFGAVHVAGEADRPRGEVAGFLARESKDRYALSLVPRDITRYVPDLFWCTILGPAHVELFGREALKAIRAHDARFVSDDMFLVRLSDDPAWVVEQPDDFEAARATVKQSLREDAFFSLERGMDGEYAVPDFAAGARPVRHVPPVAGHDVEAGQQLLDGDGDAWLVEQVAGDQASLRRVKDGLPFGVGSLSKLLATGAFERGEDPAVAAALRAKARHVRCHGGG